MSFAINSNPGFRRNSDSQPLPGSVSKARLQGVGRSRSTPNVSRLSSPNPRPASHSTIQDRHVADRRSSRQDSSLLNRTAPRTSGIRDLVQPSGNPSRLRNSGIADRPRLAVLPSKPTNGAVARLPQTQTIPFWLRSLMRLHRGSLILTFLLVSAALTVYGWTVYSQQLWSQQYQKLEDLQRAERGIIAANEGMKNSLAQQAEQAGSDLVAQSSSNTIFLQPAPQRRAQANSPATAEQKPVQNTPLGY